MIKLWTVQCALIKFKFHLNYKTIVFFWETIMFCLQHFCCFMTSMLKSPNIIIGWNAKRLQYFNFVDVWNKLFFQWLTWPCKLWWWCEMQHCIRMLGMITTLHSRPFFVMDQRGFWHTIDQQGLIKEHISHKLFCIFLSPYEYVMNIWNWHIDYLINDARDLS